MDPQKPLPREDVDDAAEELPRFFGGVIWGVLGLVGLLLIFLTFSSM